MGEVMLILGTSSHSIFANQVEGKLDVIILLPISRNLLIKN